MTTDPQVGELDTLATATDKPSKKRRPDVAEAAASEVGTTGELDWNDGTAGCGARGRDATVRDER